MPTILIPELWIKKRALKLLKVLKCIAQSYVAEIFTCGIYLFISVNYWLIDWLIDWLIIFTEQAIYKEPAVRTPSAARLKDIARGLGLDLEEAELQEFQSTFCVYAVKQIRNQNLKCKKYYLQG